MATYNLNEVAVPTNIVGNDVVMATGNGMWGGKNPEPKTFTLIIPRDMKLKLEVYGAKGYRGQDRYAKGGTGGLGGYVRGIYMAKAGEKLTFKLQHQPGIVGKGGSGGSYGGETWNSYGGDSASIYSNIKDAELLIGAGGGAGGGGADRDGSSSDLGGTGGVGGNYGTPVGGKSGSMNSYFDSLAKPFYAGTGGYGASTQSGEGGYGGLSYLSPYLTSTSQGDGGRGFESTLVAITVINDLPHAPSNVMINGIEVSTNANSPKPAYSAIPEVTWKFTDDNVGDTQFAYQVLIYEADGTTLKHDSGKVPSSASKFTVPNDKLAANTKYALKIRVWDNNDEAGTYTPLYYFVTGRTPFIDPVFPVGTEEIPQGSGVSPKLQWEFDEPENYAQNKVYLDVFDVVTGEKVLNETWLLYSSNYYVIPEGTLTAGKVYKWQVQVEDTTGLKSNITDLQYFITNHPPEKMTVISPADTHRTDVLPEFEFSISDDIEDDSQSFQIQFADDIDFTQNVVSYMSREAKKNWKVKAIDGEYQDTENGIVDSTFEGGQVKFTASEPFELNKTYYYRVRGIDESTNTGGTWSDTRSIRVGNLLQVSSTDPVITELNAQRATITAIYTLDQDGDIPAELKVEITNNGLDENPVWEDATKEFLNSEYYLLKNKVKTAEDWAVNVRFTIKANNTLGTISIRGFGVSYD